MKRISLNKIIEIDGKQNIFKLKINGKCLFDDFEKEVKTQGQYYDELCSIYSLIEDVADNKLLPKKKFRDITRKNDRPKEYEFKSKHLRVYAIKGKDGKIIIMGGYKSNQKNDLKKFRKIKNEHKKELGL